MEILEVEVQVDQVEVREILSEQVVQEQQDRVMLVVQLLDLNLNLFQLQVVVVLVKLVNQLFQELLPQVMVVMVSCAWVPMPCTNGTVMNSLMEGLMTSMARSRKTSS